MASTVVIESRDLMNRCEVALLELSHRRKDLVEAAYTRYVNEFKASWFNRLFKRTPASLETFEGWVASSLSDLNFEIAYINVDTKHVERLHRAATMAAYVNVSTEDLQYLRSPKKTTAYR